MSMVEDLRKAGPSAGSGGENEDDQTPLPVGPDEHRLEYTYGLWFIGKTNYQQYDYSLKKVGRFASVEQFWALYSHLVRPSDLHSPSDFLIFKDGIKPMWEHPANKNGGEWLVRLNKGLAARCWENLIFALLGEQFDVGDEICGAGVSMRPKKDCISLWHKNSSDTETCDKLRDTLRKILHLPSHFQMEYKNHKDVLNWVNTRDRDPNNPPAQPPKIRSNSPPNMERLSVDGDPSLSTRQRGGDGGSSGGGGRGALPPPGMQPRWKDEKNNS